jgi:hypothetical protein
MKDVTDYINKSTGGQSVILEHIRSLIHASSGDITEAIKWGFPVFASNGKDFCYLRYSKTHITFGLYHPEKITTDTDLLEGDGTVMKHIKIKSINTVSDTIIKKWLYQVLN